jgi:hypothetical protein
MVGPQRHARRQVTERPWPVDLRASPLFVADGESGFLILNHAVAEFVGISQSLRDDAFGFFRPHSNGAGSVSSKSLISAP